MPSHHQRRTGRFLHSQKLMMTRLPCSAKFVDSLHVRGRIQAHAAVASRREIQSRISHEITPTVAILIARQARITHANGKLEGAEGRVAAFLAWGRRSPQAP